MPFQKGNTIKRGTKITSSQKKKISAGLKEWWTPERREAQRLKLKGRQISPGTQFKKGRKPEESPNWKGGTSRVKRAVKVRDDYTCQICGLRDMEIMEVDHTVPISVNSELRYEINNLLTLCPNCHRRKTIRELKSGIYKTNKIQK